MRILRWLCIVMVVRAGRSSEQQRGSRHEPSNPSWQPACPRHASPVVSCLAYAQCPCLPIVPSPLPHVCLSACPPQHADVVFSRNVVVYYMVFTNSSSGASEWAALDLFFPPPFFARVESICSWAASSCTCCIASATFSRRRFLSVCGRW